MVKGLNERLMSEFVIEFFTQFDDEVKRHSSIGIMESELKKDLNSIPKEISINIENNIYLLVSKYKEIAYMMGISQGAKLQNELLHNDFAYRAVKATESE